MYFSSAAVALLASLATVVEAASYVNLTTVVGYFLQDDPNTNVTGFEYSAVNFGLINRTYEGENPSLTQWQRFRAELDRLNREAARGTSYKVMFLGRHGEGYHNAAESFYGTPAWNCYWSLLNGNGTSYWEDAHITENGYAQAVKANNYWARLIVEQKIATPDAFYTSPLARCLETAKITFAGLDLPASKPFVPTVKEYLREGVSLHTCDHRSNATWIKANYPAFRLEDGFTEFDQLFNGVTAESSTAQDLRTKAALDSILASRACKPQDLVISVTSHSGEIASILRVIGHRTFSLATGAIIPVLVRVDIIDGTAAATTATYSASAHCTVAPVTSVSGGACVCPNSAAPVTTKLVTLTPEVAPASTFTPTAAAAGRRKRAEL